MARRLRFISRGCALAAAVALLLMPWPWCRLLPAALSPYVAVCSAVAARSAGIVALLGVPLLVVSLVRRRWFCRNACPVGFLAQQVGRLHWWGSRRVVKLPPLGQWIVLVTLAGACFGYPLLVWLDPLAMFTACVGLCGQTVDAGRLVTGVGLPVLLLVSFFWPGTWCRRVCPLGATQDLLTLPKQWARGRRTDESRSRRPSPLSRPLARRPLARRSVLALGLGAAWSLITLRGMGVNNRRPLRPPGAVDEASFVGLCVRCGNCVRSCPTGVIRPDLRGLAGLFTPVVDFESGYCREDCRLCTQVCPSGAIARLSLDEKRAAPIGLARLDPAVCILAAEEQECSACVTACPFEAIKIVFDEETYMSTPRVDASKCPGCGACQVACPTTPKAIVIEA